MSNQPPILITGCPRSGASMIANIINVCGAFAGVMSETKNKLHMFENIQIRESVVKSYFDFINADVLGQYPLPNEVFIPPTWKSQVEKIITSEGRSEWGKWMYKDSRSSLIWRVWDYAFPDAKWIIVRRRTGDIIQSCVKTSFMKAFKNEDIRSMALGVNTEEEGWLWLVHQYEQRFVEMIQEGVNCKVVWPERMLKGDYSQISEMLEWVGLPWKSEVVNLIENKLQKTRNKK